MSFQHQLLNVLLRGLVIYAVLGLEFTQAHGQPGSHTTDAASLATTGRQTMTHTNVFTHPFSLPFSPFLSPVGFNEIPVCRVSRWKVIAFLWCLPFPPLPPPPPPLFFCFWMECVTWQECRHVTYFIKHIRKCFLWWFAKCHRSERCWCYPRPHVWI